MVRKDPGPPDHERTKGMIIEKFGRVDPVRLQYESTRGHTRELRICPKTCYDWGYVEMSKWTLKKDGRWARIGTVTLSPYRVLASVVEALKQVLSRKEIWVPKRRGPEGGDPDLLGITLETDGHDQFVQVRTWAVAAPVHEPTAKDLTMPLDLLPRVIEALEPFAEAVGLVNRHYLRSVFVPAPEHLPLLEKLYRLKRDKDRQG